MFLYLDGFINLGCLQLPYPYQPITGNRVILTLTGLRPVLVGPNLPVR